MIELLELEAEFWREGAACVDHPEVDFFSASAGSDETARATAICASCPVADECLGFAIETNQPDGIWGGYTTKERVKIRRRRLEDLREAS
ncbi:MAG: WhiB family transcriptional regulator [Acidimicrobiia bacterium]